MVKFTHRACTLPAFPLCREIIISHTGNSQGKDSLGARQVKSSTAAPIDTSVQHNGMGWGEMGWSGINWSELGWDESCY